MDASIQVYQTLGLRILSLTASPSILSLLGLTFITEFIVPSFFLTSNAGSVGSQILEATLIVLVGLLAAVPILLLGTAYSTGITISLVSEFLLGEIPSDSNAIDAGRKTLLSMFKLIILQSLILLVPIFASVGFWMLSASTAKPGSADVDTSAGFAVLGILIALACFIMVPIVLARFSICPQIIMFENLKPLQSFKRSGELLRGAQYIVSGYSTLISIVFLIGFLFILVLPGAIIGFELFDLDGRFNELIAVPTLGSIIAKIFQYLPNFLTVWILVPMWTTVTTILYYDRRARYDGLDIEMVARQQRIKSHASRFEL